MPNKQHILAIATVVTTIIGGGLFALPYAFAQAGLWPSLLIFAGLAVVNILMMLMFGEVVLRTEGTKHQAVGYAGIYLGKSGKNLMLGVQLLGNFGALLIYTLGAGDFLNGLFSGFVSSSQLIWGLMFFIVVALLVIFGLKIISRADFIFMLIFLAILVVVVITAIPEISFVNYDKIDFSKILFPFGVIIFSLTGVSAVPLLDDMLPKERRRMKSTIIWGVIIAALISLIFAVAVLGLGGEAVTQDSLGTISLYLPGYVSIMMGIFGIIAMGSSFLTIAVVMRETFEYDYKIPRFWALSIVLGVPLALFIANIGSFAGTISFIGAVTGGLGGVLTVWMYRKARLKGAKEPEYKIDISKLLQVVIVGVYALAIIFEIYILVS